MYHNNVIWYYNGMNWTTLIGDGPDESETHAQRKQRMAEDAFVILTSKIDVEKDWREHAACKTRVEFYNKLHPMDWDDWKGVVPWTTYRAWKRDLWAQYKAARVICADCPVRGECLVTEIEEVDGYGPLGFRGGLDERHRSEVYNKIGLNTRAA